MPTSDGTNVASRYPPRDSGFDTGSSANTAGESTSHVPLSVTTTNRPNDNRVDAEEPSVWG